MMMMMIMKYFCFRQIPSGRKMMMISQTFVPRFCSQILFSPDSIARFCLYMAMMISQILFPDFCSWIFFPDFFRISSRIKSPNFLPELVPGITH